MQMGADVARFCRDGPISPSKRSLCTLTILHPHRGMEVPRCPVGFEERAGLSTKELYIQRAAALRILEVPETLPGSPRSGAREMVAQRRRLGSWETVVQT